MTDSEDARARLEQERHRLEEVREGLDGLSDESERESLSELTSADQHPGDIGTETFDREKDLSILEQVEAELADVAHALERLDDGTYGTCEACGQPIGDERLEAVPAARFCVKDQALAETEVRTVSD
jgi:RNA polymerase-binding transcription factor DksA